MSVMDWTEFAWLKWSGEWAVLSDNGRTFASATATHDRRVARRVCRRAGIRWKWVTRTKRGARGMRYGTKRRLYWFDDDDLMRWQSVSSDLVATLDEAFGEATT